jgi:hypothetical protein
MELTLDFIAAAFHKFNKKYYDGKLETPMFAIVHRKNILGQYQHKWPKIIRISDYYDRSERDYHNTILHEMIHEFIRQNNIRDTRRHHGAVFYAEAERINRDGWNISRCDDVSGLGLKSGKNETYHIAVFKTKDGKFFKMCMNPKKINYFTARFSQHPDSFKKWFMFTSNDDKLYAHFPKCTKGIRGYYITKAEYENLRGEARSAA